MKRREYLRPKIKATDRGSAQWVLGCYLFLFLAVFLSMQMEMSLYGAAGSYLEDALAASNLASAVIDPEEFGSTHVVAINDYREAYRRYQRAVQGNLGLNAAWEPEEGGVITGPVKIVRFLIYNVSGNKVRIWEVEKGRWKSRVEGAGRAQAPNGQMIEQTSVYSEISFTVKGLFGVQIPAHKGKLVDVVFENLEE